ncbi:MAG: UDP-N-acetylmuramoyl-L-alanyl-D-glutamate--2,6-diaminopimelate ligase [Lentisphaeria bacterium]|jgi:UDP-N-acetylmuramoyl-L-alanyl-D-glutamate--2,6-diaminopimelate ligase
MGHNLSHAKNLATLLNAHMPAHYIFSEQEKSINVSDIQTDSRLVKKGSIFVALKGLTQNGETFVSAAIAKGSSAVLVDSQSELEGSVPGVPVLPVVNLTKKLSCIASRFFDEPSQKLSVVGVTGTNGKSTVVSLVAQLFSHLGKKSATLGTLGYGVIGEYLIETGMTTPDAVQCQRILADLVDEHVDVVSMEVSSHGIDQNRVSSISFGAVILTNITRDHLDYHGSFSAYAETKTAFVCGEQSKLAIINLDDDLGLALVESLQKSQKPFFCFAIKNSQADVYVKDVEYFPTGMRVSIHSPWGAVSFITSMVGSFNLSNILAAVTAICGLGQSLEKVVAGIHRLRPVAGRMQRVDPLAHTPSEGAYPKVYVDYAHTPDALEKSLEALAQHTCDKIWVVFGCGGDRDKGKRPQMARIAQMNAHCVVVTSDNPRSESPASIIDDIAQGFSREKNTSAIAKIGDRKEAIEFAINNCEINDCVLVAGKGHEDYQIIGNQKKTFSDYLVAQQALTGRLIAGATHSAMPSSQEDTRL